MNGLRNGKALSHLRALDSRGWYRISNVREDDAGKAEILIYDEIGWLGITAEDFVKDLQRVEADEIKVRINSIGGSVFGGTAIYNALRTHPARITTTVDSLAASVASVIVQAGDERVMVQHSQMMIHNAWGIAIGDADEMNEYAELLRKEDSIIADIYADRSGKPRSMYIAMMAAETWFSHDEAVEAGLADSVYVPERKTVGEDDEADVAAAATAKPRADLQEEDPPTDTPEQPHSVKFGDLFEDNPFADLSP